MAVPTISVITPAVAFSGGHLVTITGTGFQLPYPPPVVSGVLPTPPPTVSVTVGGRAAKRITVVSGTTMHVLLGPMTPGAQSVTLTNLDVDGVAIPGESVTTTTRLTAQRADLAIEADLTRIERALIRELKRQVIENVLKTAATDYDGTTGGVFDVPDVGSLPAIAVQGPQVVDNRFYDPDLGFTAINGSAFTKRHTFKTVNLTYRFVAMDNKQVRNMNLMALMLQFLQQNPTLEMLRDERDSTKGYVEYELAQVGEFTTFTGASSSDIRGFSGSLVIRGFQLEDVAGFIEQAVAERGSTVDTVTVESQGFLPDE